MTKKKASTLGKSTAPLKVPLNDSRVTENEKHDGDFDDDLFEISNNTNNSNISQKSGNLFLKSDTSNDVTQPFSYEVKTLSTPEKKLLDKYASNKNKTSENKNGEDAISPYQTPSVSDQSSKKTMLFIVIIKANYKDFLNFIKFLLSCVSI